MKRLLFVSALASFAAAAAGQEIPLGFERAEDLPLSYVACEPLEEGDEEGWSAGEGFLTPAAVSTRAYFPALGLDEEGLLLAVDGASEGPGVPHVLFVDLDGDRGLDDGERFPLVPAAGPAALPPDAPVVLRAEGIPVARRDGSGSAPGGGEPVLVNIFFRRGPGPDARAGGAVELAMMPYGWWRGETELGGATFRAVIRDRNVNGACGDFEEDAGDAADTLALFPAGSAGPAAAGRPAGYPLRRRMVLGGRTFGVNVATQPRPVLALTPVEAPFGEVETAAPGLEVTLRNKDWGSLALPASRRAPVPAGAWEATEFRRIDLAAGVAVVCAAEKGLKAEVAAGRITSIPLDPALQAKVTARLKGKTVELVLALATSQGYAFKALEQVGGGSGAAAKGVPFAITDRPGRRVHEGLFPFG